jgi:hypothetical protein
MTNTKQNKLIFWLLGWLPCSHSRMSSCKKIQADQIISYQILVYAFSVTFLSHE